MTQEPGVNEFSSKSLLNDLRETPLFLGPFLPDFCPSFSFPALPLPRCPSLAAAEEAYLSGVSACGLQTSSTRLVSHPGAAGNADSQVPPRTALRFHDRGPFNSTQPSSRLFDPSPRKGDPGPKHAGKTNTVRSWERASVRDHEPVCPCVCLSLG